MVRSLPGTKAHPAELQAKLVAVQAGRPDIPVRTRHLADDRTPLYTNRLALESSPYLRQHAHNPVNWFAWGDEAFAEARRLGRPVFLSIGYSTCHWCHVMEEESFEDETIARFLNAHYVSIKVDREERPDVDAVYMRAAQQFGGMGGWPLSAWLTADREPFFVGTYFPPYAGQRGSGHGFLDLLTELASLFGGEHERVHDAAHALTEAVRADMEVAANPAHERGSPPHARPDVSLVAHAVEQCARGFDDENGGLRAMQKFPSHVPIRLLLRHHQRTGDLRALHMAVRTLEAMAAGGIYDHVAGGFHRYATDPFWRVPHFEKMLYDNALLVVAYAEAWQVTKRPTFARVVHETCDDLLATLASAEGGFYSATDADSDGKEGRYFTWTEDEILTELGSGEDAGAFLRYYGVTKQGNSEFGNILFQAQPDEGVTQRLAPARIKLAQARRRRVPPLRDEKILAAWNGLAISALAVAGRVLGKHRYLEAAVRAADFLLSRMREAGTGRLARSFRDGQLGVAGFLDDYAFTAAGLLDLFESTGDPRWFDHARHLIEETEDLFADPVAGGWFTTSKEHERLLARQRPMFDGAEPAGSSVALMNVARLAAFTDDSRWRSVAERAVAFYLPRLSERPMTMTEMLLAVDTLAGPMREIVITLPAGDAAAGGLLLLALRQAYCPRAVLFSGQPGSPAWRTLEQRIPWLSGKTATDAQAMAYVCTQGRCNAPTASTEEFLRQIAG